MGEFGWELFSWQAYCRSASSMYDFCIVISRSGNDYLYSDFCNAFFALDPDPEGISESFLNSAVQTEEPQFALKQLAEVSSVEFVSSYAWTWMPPRKIGNPPYDHPHASIDIPHIGVIKPNYRLYRGSLEPSDERVDVLFHARDRKVRKHENWNLDKWKKLESMLGPDIKIGCIGTSHDSFEVPNTVDYRDVSLEKVTALMRHAKCIVGPSSGPLHLAALSGCPQVWWTDNPNKNLPRYTYMWNPFHVSTSMVPGKDPEPEEVASYIMNLKE